MTRVGSDLGTSPAPRALRPMPHRFSLDTCFPRAEPVPRQATRPTSPPGSDDRVDSATSAGHLAGMSTLVQIESAVAELPPQDQWSLLTWLQGRLAAAPEAAAAKSNDREEWLVELAELRAKTHTGGQGVPLQQVMDDLREDRC